MNFVIDITPVIEFFSQPINIIMLKFLFWFGWIPLVWVFLYGAKEMWIYYIQNRWSEKIGKIVLAIDIPRGNTQSPKAVESIFTYLAGAHGTKNLIEKYWLGVFQLSFSMEIVSINGYTQFLVKTPSHFRDLVESAVYSQYPDAEITEVDDYVKNAPDKFPDDEYDMWGAEFIQTAPVAYPIILYDNFLHNMGKPEEQFKDPMASLMDLYSSLKPGEECWFQIIIQPRLFGWLDAAEDEVKKVLKDFKPKDLFFNKIIDKIFDFINMLWSPEVDSKNDEPDALKMMNLTPKEKNRVESIYHKMSKWGFNTKLRFIYLAKKEVMNKPKAVSGFVGWIKQFSSLDLNGLKPDMNKTATSVSYFFKNYRLKLRQNKIMSRYKGRDLSGGKVPGLMNTEELATLWHFPVEAVVKAPMIQKAPGRKSEPPMALPVDEREETERASDEDNIFNIPSKDKLPEEPREENIPAVKGSAPSNLPFA